jgi:hypothetical protein
MAATTGVSSQADAQTRLQLWLDAEEAISKGASYSIGDRSLTRANLSEVTERIGYWQRQVQSFRAAGQGAGSPGIRVAKWVG